MTLDQQARSRLLAHGWKFKGSGQCRRVGCVAIVEYWQKGKEVSIRNYIGMTVHWPTCSGGKKKNVVEGGSKKAPSEKQLDLFEGASA